MTHPTTRFREAFASPALEEALEVPSWACRWLAAEGAGKPGVDPGIPSEPWVRTEEGWWLRRVEGEELRLISVRATDAVELGAPDFEATCARIYRRCLGELASTAHRPVRLWNHIPKILEPLGGLEHRYMVFNAGRFRALCESNGDYQGNGSRLPVEQVATASGVGHHGSDLVVHCLAARRRGEPVENPRQVPAYRYSKRYGPRPPCFARATRWVPAANDPAGSWLLVGGTASVLGEDSVFPGDLEAQLAETLRNLAALVGSPDLDGYQHLRIYYVRPDHLPALRGILGRRLGESVELEFRHAELCRPELLVEIEGLARLARPRPRLKASQAVSVLGAVAQSWRQVVGSLMHFG